MRGNIKPVVLLLTLFALLTFLVGFRLGRRIEKVDQAYVPPTPIVAQELTVTPADKLADKKSPVSYTTFIHETCGVTFLYPDRLEQIDISSAEARLVSNEISIRVLCDGSIEKSSKEALASLPSPRKITIGGIQTDVYQTEENTQIVLLGSDTQAVLLEVPDELAPLVFKTVEVIE